MSVRHIRTYFTLRAKLTSHSSTSHECVSSGHHEKKSFGSVLISKQTLTSIVQTKHVTAPIQDVLMQLKKRPIQSLAECKFNIRGIAITGESQNIGNIFKYTVF